MGQFDTTIIFDGDRNVDVEMTSVSFSIAWLINKRWTLRSAYGDLTDGSFDTENGLAHEVDSGSLATIGAEYRAQAGKGGSPTIDFSLYLSRVWAETVAPNSSTPTDYSALDLRFGGRAGWLVGKGFFPYGAVRLFGGPVNWQLEGEDVTGSDKYHYQVALGAAVTSGIFGVFAEWAGLGEQGFSVGLSAAW